MIFFIGVWSSLNWSSKAIDHEVPFWCQTWNKKGVFGKKTCWFVRSNENHWKYWKGVGWNGADPFEPLK